MRVWLLCALEAHTVTAFEDVAAPSELRIVPGLGMWPRTHRSLGFLCFRPIFGGVGEFTAHVAYVGHRHISLLPKLELF